MRRATNANPEGPYEIAGGQRVEGASAPDTREVIEFLADLQEDARSLLPLSGDLRSLKIVLELVGNHLAGRLTTTSSLAGASGLSYGTAIRSIDDLVTAGHIAKRPRTATGKSFSLHPSASLLRQWHLYAGTVRRAAEGLARHRERPLQRRRSGTRQLAEVASIIPPLAALETKLTLSRGLRVLVHADPTFMAMNSLKRQFELILGVEIHVRALSIDRLRREIVANSEHRLSDYDIIACDLPWFGEMASAGRLRPLDDVLARSAVDLRDFIPDAVASARWNGLQFGVPVMATSEMLAFRSDLLAEAGIAPPRTLPELVEAARKLNRPEKGVFGIAWNGGRGTALGHTFMTIMAAQGQPIVNLARAGDGFDVERASGESLRPMFLSDAARETAAVLSELLAFSPPEILSMVWYDRARAFASGRTAMAYYHTMLANLIERDPSSAAHGRTGYLPHPTGLGGRPVSPLGGYALSIPSNIAQERVAQVWDAIVALTSASAAKLYILHGSLASPRFSVNRDPEVSAISRVIGIVDRMARDRTLRMWPRPPVPGISTVIQIAGEEIHDMLIGAKSPERALGDAQTRADALMRQRGAY